MANTLNQKILERGLRHHFNVQRYGSKLAADTLALLNSLDEELEAKIRSRLETNDAGAATTRNLQKLLDEIRELNDAAVSKMASSLPGRLDRFAVVEEQTQRDIIEGPLGEALGYRYKLRKLAPNALAGIVKSRPWDGKVLSEHFSTFGTKRGAAVIKKVNTGLAQGSTIEQIVSSVMGKRVRGGRRGAPVYEGGVLDESRKDVRSLVRSYVSHTLNETRDDLFKANDDVISGQMWVATLDENTTAFCMTRDGLVYGLDHKPVGHDLAWDAGPGRAHWQCRSTSIPVIKAMDDLPIDWSKVGKGKGQRAAVNRDDLGNYINGQAPASSNYGEWLRSQPRRVQEDVLGKARAKWFNENPEATLGEAWAQNFKIRPDDHLTLRQLAAKSKEQNPGVQRSVSELRAASSLSADDLPEIEQALLGESSASAYLFDSKGRKVQIVDGRRTQIDIPDALSRQLEGGTLTHNHVNGRSFSSDDIGYASRFGLEEMRAVGINDAGEAWRYSARPGENGWPPADAILDEWERLDDIVANYLWNKVQAGDLTREEAEALHDHELMRRLARRLGFAYSRKGIR